jgi:hypothetical protein
MHKERLEFLNLRILPIIIGFLEVFYLTGISVDGLIFLERVGHLKALANPPPGTQRYFLTSNILKLANDEQWCAKAIRLIREHSRKHNQARKQAKEKVLAAAVSSLNGSCLRRRSTF